MEKDKKPITSSDIGIVVYEMLHEQLVPSVAAVLKEIVGAGRNPLYAGSYVTLTPGDSALYGSAKANKVLDYESAALTIFKAMQTYLADQAELLGSLSAKFLSSKPETPRETRNPATAGINQMGH